MNMLRTLAAIFLASALPTLSVGNDLSFEKDIRPILKAHCFHCHGEQGETEGDLDLRLRRLILSGGESGP
ncbi:MAG: c-type cytochrome domain-containing protein, partial [Planctomycetota bacterium]|nr:c-type cytochrome domain-containing protein [Planctomycetota bacterium]